MLVCFSFLSYMVSEFHINIYISIYNFTSLNVHIKFSLYHIIVSQKYFGMPIVFKSAVCREKIKKLNIIEAYIHISLNKFCVT